MNKFVKSKKMIIGATTLAMLAGAVGGVSYFDSSAKENVTKKEVEKNTNTDAKSNDEKILTAQITSGLKAESKNAYKNETVYAFADKTGAISKVVVNEHLANKDGADTLVDITDLTNIENIKGNEEYLLDGNKITWEANGKDIYYQGESTKKLPIDMKITYKLDGKDIDANELIGKSGRVTIRFDYKNNTSVVKKINGQDESIKIPFVTITGVMLNDGFDNVEVVNGRILSEGRINMVLGYALPGLVDSMGVKKEEFEQDFDIPDYFEFSADVREFNLGMTVTMIANGSNIVMGSEINLDKMDELMGGLSSAGSQLSAGSDELTNGISTLSSKMNEFDAGMGELKNGIDSLVAGSGDIANGIYAVDNSAQAIAGGIDNLDAALNAPMSDEQISAIASSAAAEAEGAFAPGSDTYNYIYNTAATQFSETMTGQATVDSIYQALYANLHDSLYSAGIANAMQYAMANGIEVTMEDIIASQGGEIEANIQGSLYELASGIASGIATNGKDAMGVSVVEACKQSAASAAGQAAVAGAEGAKSNIATQIETQAENGYSLVTGARALADGTSQLAGGVPSLTTGIDSLSKGAGALASGSSQLVDGTNRLLDGSSNLRDGINKFNNDAINKMVSAYNGDVKNFVARMEAIIAASSEYDTYTMLEEGKEGNTKIIIKTAELK